LLHVRRKILFHENQSRSPQVTPAQPEVGGNFIFSRKNAKRAENAGGTGFRERVGKIIRGRIISTRTRSCADSLFRIKPCSQGCPGDSGRRLFTINISRSTIYNPLPSEPLGGSSSEAGGKIPAVHENVRRALPARERREPKNPMFGRFLTG
jgi:hypothetical protein